MKFRFMGLSIIENNNAALVDWATPDAADKARPTVNAMNYGKVDSCDITLPFGQYESALNLASLVGCGVFGEHGRILRVGGVL